MGELIIVLIVLGLVYWLVLAHPSVAQPFKNLVLMILVLIAIWKLLQFAGMV